MHKRFFATVGLAGVILFSQSSGFLVAALCPHLRPRSTHCNTQPAEKSISHHDLGHTSRDSTQARSVNTGDEAVTLGQPLGLCNHCAVHSRTTSNPAVFKNVEAPKRPHDLTISVLVSRAEPIASSPAAVVTSRSHGPPGDQTPRHILINIFRI
jgi:hypothetical protein